MRQVLKNLSPGFLASLVNWLTPYLSALTQMVLFNGAFSHSINVTSCVPQGSHLGPILFALFINDVPHVLRSVRMLLYADEIKLFPRISDITSHCRFQEDLNVIAEWCSATALYLTTHPQAH